MSKDQKKKSFWDSFMSDKNEKEADKQKETTQYQNIDETQIDFILKGGPNHSDLLVAEATYKFGLNQGQPIPLMCKWFIVNQNNECSEIEGITGAFYQPCADDVGIKVCVQAIPVLDSEYQGMPLMKEVGPLILDSSIQQEVQELLEAGKTSLLAKLESVQIKKENLDELIDFSSLQLPRECVIKINLDILQIELKKEGVVEKVFQQQLEEDYPLVKMNKKTNNIFEIQFSHSQTFKIKAPSNQMRDIIAVSVRMFCGQKILLKQMQLEETTQQDQLQAPSIQQQTVEQQIDSESTQVITDPQQSQQNEQTTQSTINDNKVQEENNQQELLKQNSDFANNTNINDNNQQNQQIQSTQQQSSQSEIKEQQDSSPQANQKQLTNGIQNVQSISLPNIEFVEKQENAPIIKSIQEENINNNNNNIQVSSELDLSPEVRLKKNQKSMVNADASQNDLQKLLKSKTEIQEVTSANQTPSNQQQAGFEFYVKFNEMHKKLQKQSKTLQDQTIDIDLKQKEIERLKFKTETLDEQLKNCSTNYFDLQKENEILKTKQEKYLKEKLFLIQEVNFLRSKVKEKDKEVYDVQQICQQIKEQYKNNRNTNPLEINELQQQIELFASRISDLARENGQLKENLQNYEQKIEQQDQDKEEFLTEINVLNKKYQSLMQEKKLKMSILNQSYLSETHSVMSDQDDNYKKESGILQSQSPIPQRQVPAFSPFTFRVESADSDQKSEGEKDEEITKLRCHIKLLESTLESMKTAYDRDVIQKHKSSEKKLKSQKEEHYLKKLANQLAETITEKELQIENYKKINKELIKKIKEFEKYIIDQESNKQKNQQ